MTSGSATGDEIELSLECSIKLKKFRSPSGQGIGGLAMGVVKYALVVAATVSLMAEAKPAGFYVERLPTGADVTLPIPATTYIPLTQRVMLTSTDVPQSISLRTVSTSGARLVPIQVSIFDSNSDRVKYIDLMPGQPFLYKFENLSSIYVIPKMPKGQNNNSAEHMKVQIESDKPLSIAR